MTYSLTYYDMESITATESFTEQAPEVNPINSFISIAYSFVILLSISLGNCNYL